MNARTVRGMRILLLAVLGVLLATPAAANATIVPQEGMKGVKLRMTVEAVRDKLGTPSRNTVEQNEIIGRTRVLQYGLTEMVFDGTTESSRMISITTTSRSEKTSNGIGIGSTRRDVDRRVSRTRCVIEDGFDHCYIGAFEPGRVVTDFVMNSKGRVKSITIGRVID